MTSQISQKTYTSINLFALSSVLKGNAIFMGRTAPKNTAYTIVVQLF